LNVDMLRERLALLGDPSSVLTSLFAFSPIPIQVYQPDGSCLLVNDAFCQLFGAAPPPGYNVFEDDAVARAGVLDILRRAFGGESVRVPPVWYDPRELRHPTVEGGRRVAVEAHCVPILAGEGAVAFVLILFHDRTDEMLAKEQLDELLERERAAHAEAENQRQRLRLLFEQAPVNITMHEGPDLVFVMSNTQHQALTGDRPLVGSALRDAMPELRGQGVVEALTRVYESGEPFVGNEMRTEVRGPDGAVHTRFFDVVWQPVRDAAGKIEGVMTFSYDITEQVLARERAEALAAALGESEELFRVAQELSPHGFSYHRAVRDESGAVVDLEWVYQNEPASRLNRLPAGRAAAGTRMLVAFPGLRGDPLWEHYRHVAETGETWRGEIDYRGEHFDQWFQITAVRVGDGLALTFEDVTARKAAEDERARLLVAERAARAEAEADRARLKALVAQLPMGVTLLLEERGERGGEDRGELRYVTASERYLALAAKTADQLFGRTPPEAFPELDGQGYFELIEQVHRTGEAVHGIGAPAAWDDDGDGEPEQHFVDFVYAPLRGAGGRVEGIVIVVTQVDERVRAEQERASLLERERRARVEVEMASRAKDEFISVASHELRTPLNAILGWVQMLSSGMLNPDQSRKAIGTIERNAKAQAQLIDDLLDISRIIAGKLRLEVGPVDLARVIEAALDVVTPAAEAKGVRLTAVLDRPAFMTGDPDRLQQVVWNLLSNAVKFTPRGGQVVVRLEGASADGARVISVEDSGQGIEPEFLPHVFERFRQADMATTRKHGGLGLGLAIVRQLVEMHGGQVEATSEGEGRGSTFRVRLPVAPPPASGPAVSLPHAVPDFERQAPAFECPPGIEGLRVLVVDDEPDAREMLASMLVHCKARVSTASSAEEALERLREELPDVVVSDVGMPGEDGYALIARMRRLPSEEGGRTPAVALTAYARAEDRTKALRAGFDTHVTKPVQPTELLLVVARIAGRAPGSFDPGEG